MRFTERVFFRLLVARTAAADAFQQLTDSLGEFGGKGGFKSNIGKPEEIETVS